MSRLPLVAHVVGARPNYMKIAPIYFALARLGSVEQRLIHTGQHYDAELKDVFFDELTLPRPHAELGVGSGSQAEQTAGALVALERVFLQLEPDIVVVPGDVNSTLAGALAAGKLGIPVCHVEAGLRSFDWTMPEEHNRRLTDHLSSLLLTHCQDAGDNLQAEGIPEERVALVGNTMIDTLVASLDAARAIAAWDDYGLSAGRYVLVTLHRPALVDDPDLLERTMASLDVVARKLPVLFPLHPRTRQRLEGLGIVPQRVVVTAPLPYGRFLSLESAAAAVVTDSGGVQEETTALGVPCFTLRDNTERPVTVTRGTNTLLGLDPAALEAVPACLASPRIGSVPPLWDGLAGRRAALEIERALGVGSAAETIAGVGVLR